MASSGGPARSRDSGLTVASYALVTRGALICVLSPLGLLDYRLGLELAGFCWGGAFVVFLVA